MLAICGIPPGAPIVGCGPPQAARNEAATLAHSAFRLDAETLIVIVSLPRDDDEAIARRRRSLVVFDIGCARFNV
jgi:hypothetical protein